MCTSALHNNKTSLPAAQGTPPQLEVSSPSRLPLDEVTTQPLTPKALSLD